MTTYYYLGIIGLSLGMLMTIAVTFLILPIMLQESFDVTGDNQRIRRRLPLAKTCYCLMALLTLGGSLYLALREPVLPAGQEYRHFLRAGFGLLPAVNGYCWLDMYWNKIVYFFGRR